MATGSEPIENSEEKSSKKPSYASVLVPVAVILTVILFAMGYLRDRQRESRSSSAGGRAPEQVIGRKIGQPIQDVTLTTQDGTKTKLSELKAKVVVINFWATWCPPCVREMPSLQKLYDTYKDRGLLVAAVNVDDNPEKVLAPFLAKHKIHLPIYVDPKGEVGNQFDVSGLPLTLVVDQDRKLLLEQVGDEDWFDSDFRKQFEIWLAGAAK